MPGQPRRPSATTTRFFQTMKPGNVRPTDSTEPSAAAPPSSVVASPTATNSRASARRRKRASMRQRAGVDREAAATAPQAREVLQVHRQVEEQVRRPQQAGIAPEPRRPAQECLPAVVAFLDAADPGFERTGRPAVEVEHLVLEVVLAPVARADASRGIELLVRRCSR